MSIATAPAGPLGAAAYADKPVSYFDGARADLVARLPESTFAAILEIGCGTGATGALALRERRCGRYCGVELFEGAAAEARRVLSEVVTGDVERLELPWQPGAFDALILSEVLEHLIEPGRLLRRLRPLLRQGGTVLASSPNISHWRVIAELMRGRFDLADRGVFDRTHMRWFTPRTFAAMFEEAGFVVSSVGPVTPFAPRTKLLSRLSGGGLDHLFMVQICLEARRR